MPAISCCYLGSYCGASFMALMHAVFQMVAAFSVSPTAMERFCVGDFAIHDRSSLLLLLSRCLAADEQNVLSRCLAADEQKSRRR
jgi:hypothetical protein